MNLKNKKVLVTRPPSQRANEYYYTFEACLSKEVAIKWEKYFKTGFGRRFLKNRLAGLHDGRVGPG